MYIITGAFPPAFPSVLESHDMESLKIGPLAFTISSLVIDFAFPAFAKLFHTRCFAYATRVCYFTIPSRFVARFLLHSDTSLSK